MSHGASEGERVQGCEEHFARRSEGCSYGLGRLPFEDDTPQRQCGDGNGEQKQRVEASKGLQGDSMGRHIALGI